MRPYALINLFFEPAARIVLTVVLLAAGWGLQGAMVALVVTNVAASLLAATALRRLMGTPSGAPTYRVHELFSFSAAAWLSSLASSGLLWADTILLGIFGSAADVGIYQVATRLTLLATIFIGPIGTAFAPRIADLYERGLHDRLARTYSLVTSWVVRLSLPAFVVLIVFPRELLAIFGPRFPSGAAVTVTLALGQLINVATGPCGYMLVMSGRPRLQTINNVTVLIANIALNLWLIPRYGMLGAAIAWATTIMLGNLARVAQVWVTMRMVGFDRGAAKGAVAGSVALAICVAVQAAVDGVAGLVTGALLGCLAYMFVIVRLGIGADDRLLLDAFKRRLRGST